MFFGLFLLTAFVVCLMAAIGLGAVGVVLFAIILYQPFACEFVPRRQMRFWLSIALAVVLWVAFATMFGDGGLKGYIASAGIEFGISLVSFWLIGLDSEPEDEQPKTGEGNAADNPVGQDEDGGSLPAAVQGDTSSEDTREAEETASDNDSTDKYAPKPHVSGPDVVGPELFVELEFLGNRIEISTCARQLMEFRNGAASIIEPLAEQIADQTKWLRGPGGGHWTTCAMIISRAVQTYCGAPSTFSKIAARRAASSTLGIVPLKMAGLPNPRELSTIAMEAIGARPIEDRMCSCPLGPRTHPHVPRYRRHRQRLRCGRGVCRKTPRSSQPASASSRLPRGPHAMPILHTSRWSNGSMGRNSREMDRTMREIGMREYYLPSLAFPLALARGPHNRLHARARKSAGNSTSNP